MQKFSRLPDFRRQSSGPAPVSGELFLHFSHARTALKFGLSGLDFKKGDRVLIPDFICDVAVHPFEQLGVDFDFYSITDKLTPNWNMLEMLVASNEYKAVMLVHYFGFPQDVLRFQRFCVAHDVLLIEDNAHGFGAELDGKMLGSFGDIGFSAPRKVLPIGNGGLLWERDFKAPDSNLKPEPAGGESSLKAGVKSALEKIPGAVRLLRGKRPDYHVPDAFLEPAIGEWAMDSEAVAQLWEVDLVAIRSQRQAIYKIWFDWANQREDLTPVFPEMPDGAFPQIFAAWAPDEDSRNRWLDWGYDRRIDVHTWPTLPKQILDLGDDSGVRKRWGRLVCFPIHQEMDGAALAKLINS